MAAVSPKSRSKIMASIRSKNTKPELAVRSALHRMGFRFRLHCSHLPGKPDMVLPKYKAIVWIHGCFWHGHSRCPIAKRPQTNVDYWRPKIDRNIARDRKNRGELKQRGWCNLVVWECETLNEQEFKRKMKSIKARILERMTNSEGTVR